MLDVPEHIGYLKSLGLDYGWGPTGLMEWTLEHVHVLSGTPWWVSISLTALLVRGVLFYPYIGAAENGARMSATSHLTKPIMEKSKEAMLAGDETTSQQLRAELMRINKRAGIAYWKSFAPMLQIVPGMGTFFLLKAMANLPVPGLETGGALWFYNLAIPDPYLLFPIMTATVLHWLLRVSSTSDRGLAPTDIFTERRRDGNKHHGSEDDEGHDVGYASDDALIHLVAPCCGPALFLRLWRAFIPAVHTTATNMVPQLVGYDTYTCQNQHHTISASITI